MRGARTRTGICRRPACRRRGMALVEVLLSISIISVSLGISMQTLSLCTRLESRSVKMAKARRLADGKVLDLRASGATLSDGESGGRFEAPFEAYRWVARMHWADGTPPRTHIELLIYQGEREAPLFRTETLLAQGGR